MYVQVAHYRLGTGAVEELRARVEAGPVRQMREMPGFVDYYAFDAGDGVVASVSVFQDRASLEEAERRLEGWIEETVERFNIEPAAVSEGPVFATTRASG